eukprot:TRINITY_DN1726_c0_g1_i1.p1 TRINITY_DN1726_c0_g1~~TRINITY_DN1726_c0_g1_i1.p1  ORF type:complete len:138 (+),score=59.60 TRINITY_DN1726_c0_g1_i1:47-460(+)
MAPNAAGTKVDLQAVMAAAAEQLDEHEKAPTHASTVLANLLAHAPSDAHVFDVLAHSYRVSQACGLPPGVAGIPGKNLLSKGYAEYAVRYPRVEPEGITDEQRKEMKLNAMGEWKDLSDLLGNAVKMLMSRVDDAGK